MQRSDHIWPGSVRAFVSLCFLMLTLIFVTNLDRFMHHTLNHTIRTKIQTQEKLYLRLKENPAFRYHIHDDSSSNSDDELKA